MSRSTVLAILLLILAPAIAHAQLTYVQLVVLDGHEAGGPQRIINIDPILDCPPHELVNVPHDELVGMLVVAAEHGHSRVLAKQRVERVEVAGGGAFANGDLAAGGELVEGFFFGEAFVVGGDAGCDVFGSLFAPEAYSAGNLSFETRRSSGWSSGEFPSATGTGGRVIARGLIFSSRITRGSGRG